MKKLLVIVLTVLLALSLAACGTKQTRTADAEGLIRVNDGDTLGDGKTTLTVTITGEDEKAVTVTVKTDETTVGEALESIGLIRGEEGPYGIYIHTVNQERHVYEEDGMYWAFYINGEYAATGADMTGIDSGVQYAFAAEKG